jgi:hypothetical protein
MQNIVLFFSFTPQYFNRKTLSKTGISDMKKYSKNISTLESAIILELIIFARSNVKMSSSAAMMEKNAMKKRLLMRSTPGKAVENPINITTNNSPTAIKTAVSGV